MTDAFRSRVDTNVRPVFTPSGRGTDPVGRGLQAIGAALGDAADTQFRVREQVAESETRIAEDERRRQRSATIADRAGAWAEVQAGIAGGIDELRRTSKPGAPGHVDAVKKLIGERVGAFRATLGDDAEVVERFSPMVSGWVAQTELTEQRWGIGEGAKHEAAGVEKLANGMAGEIAAAGDRAGRLAAFERNWAAVETIGGGLDLPGSEREAFVFGQRRVLVRTLLDTMLAGKDQAGVKALLDDGRFDQYLDAERGEKGALYRRVQIADEGDARAAEAAAGEQRRAAQDALDTIEAKRDAGIVPSAAEVRAADAAAEGAGVDAATLVKFRAGTVRDDVNRRYAGLLTRPGGADQLRGLRDTLAAKVASGKASESEQVALRQMDSLVDRADTQEAERAKREGGLLDDAAKSGPEGMLRALGTLRGTPEAVWDRAEKIDKGLGSIAVLPAPSRALAIRGREVLKARPKEFGTPLDAAAAADWHVGPLIRGQLGSAWPAIRDNARAIYAQLMQDRRKDGFDRQVFREAMLFATGATPRGDGRVQGGIDWVRGRAVQLPDWSTAAEFAQTLARTDFAANGAVYQGGKPADSADVREHYRPVHVGDDAAGNPLYQFEDAAGGLLQARKGGAFTLTARRR